MRALVTGGAGFIGSNLVDALLDRGDEVAVVDDLSTGRRENLRAALARGASFHEADIRDAGRMRRAVRRGAARHRLPPRRADRRAQVDRRTRPWTRASTSSARSTSSRRRAPSASSASSTPRPAARSTARPTSCPTPESVPPRPMAAYGQSKFCAEAYCGWYERLYGLSSVTLRYGNVYGPRQDPHGEAGVIAIFCGKLLDGGRPLDLRRRPPDARLRLRGRHRRRQPRRGRAPGGPRGVQRRHRHRGVGARGPRRAARRGRPGRGRVRARVRAGAAGRGPAQLARRRRAPAPSWASPPTPTWWRG